MSPVQPSSLDSTQFNSARLKTYGRHCKLGAHRLLNLIANANEQIFALRDLKMYPKYVELVSNLLSRLESTKTIRPAEEDPFNF